MHLNSGLLRSLVALESKSLTGDLFFPIQFLEMLFLIQGISCLGVSNVYYGVCVHFSELLSNRNTSVTRSVMMVLLPSSVSQ